MSALRHSKRPTRKSLAKSPEPIEFKQQKNQGRKTMSRDN